MSEALATWDLTRWLLEQIADDEEVSRLAAPGPWSTQSGLHVLDATGEHAPVRQAGHFEDGWHIARWDPERALAECDAKRRILDEHGIVYRDIGFLEEDGDELVDATEEIPVCGRCVPKHSSFNRREDIPIGPCRTVRLLALPVADRPGYLEEWRP